MGKQVTFGHILTILISIIIPLFIWGVSVETRFTKVNSNTKNIDLIGKEVKSLKISNQNNQKEILDKLHSIELTLKDKKDRE